MSGAMMPYAMEGCVMRHDPASAAVVVMLKALKLYGMAQAVGDLIEQGAPAFSAAVPMVSQLLKAEMAEREVRSIAYQIKAARFPAYKDLAGFDFASSEANEALVRQLHGEVDAVQIAARHRQIAHRHCAGSSSRRASPQKSALLCHCRSGQRARTGKSSQQGGADCRTSAQARSHHP